MSGFLLRALFVAIFVCLAPNPISRIDEEWRAVADELVQRFNTFDLVALGEWHGSKDDADLRAEIVEDPGFPEKARVVVIECGNSRYQDTLDRYIAGESVAYEQIRRVWRDVATPGGCDSPLYEDFLLELRSLNRGLSPALKVRVLAAGPPINWSKIQNRLQWRAIAESSDRFAADLIEREVLRKGYKGLLVIGAGHLWRKNRLVARANLEALLEERFPARTYTVIRLDRRMFRATGADDFAPSDGPVLLSLSESGLGELGAERFIGAGLHLFASDTRLRDVADACVLTMSQSYQGNVRREPRDAAYEAEKQRRLRFLR